MKELHHRDVGSTDVKRVPVTQLAWSWVGGLALQSHGTTCLALALQIMTVSSGIKKTLPSSLL